jgi:TonB family protein
MNLKGMRLPPIAFLVTFGCLSPSLSQAQPDSLKANTGDTTQQYITIEEPPSVSYHVLPSFFGGEQALMEYLSTTIKYPNKALNNFIEGVVFVQFVVNEKGEVTQPRVLKGIGYGCDEEALRAVSLMPNWQPGIQNGKAVSVEFKLPVRFKLVYGKESRVKKRAERESRKRQDK